MRRFCVILISICVVAMITTEVSGVEMENVIRAAFVRNGLLDDSYLFEYEFESGILNVSYGTRRKSVDNLNNPYIAMPELFEPIVVGEEDRIRLRDLIDEITRDCEPSNYRDGTMRDENGNHLWSITEGYDYYFSINGKKYGFHELEIEWKTMYVDPLMELFKKLEELSPIPIILYRGGIERTWRESYEEMSKLGEDDDNIEDGYF